MGHARPALIGSANTEVIPRGHFGCVTSCVGIRAADGEPKSVSSRSLLRLAVLVALGVGSMPEAVVGQTHYDLTKGGSLLVDQTYFFAGTPSAVAGSGSFGPVVRLQNNGSEEGYNSAASPVMADVKNGVNFRFADFRVPANSGGMVNGVAYYSFALDINEGSGGDNPFLSLDKLQFYVRSTDFSGTGGDTPNSVANLSSTATKVYDLDSGGDKSLLLDGSLVGGGSSTVDLVMLVPQSVFAPYTTSAHNVFLYFQMGALGTTAGHNWTTDSGFEEWNAVSGLTFTIPEPVPEPGTVGAAAAVIAVSGWSWYSRKRNRNRRPGCASPNPSPTENGVSIPAPESLVESTQA